MIFRHYRKLGYFQALDRHWLSVLVRSARRLARMKKEWAVRDGAKKEQE